MKFLWMLFGLLPVLCTAQNLDWVTFQGENNLGDQLFEAFVTPSEEVVFCGKAYYSKTGYDDYIINLSKNGTENWRIRDTSLTGISDIVSDGSGALFAITRSNAWKGKPSTLLVVKYDDLGTEEWRYSFPTSVIKSQFECKMSIDYNGDVVVSMPKKNGGLDVHHIDGQKGSFNWMQSTEQIGSAYITRPYTMASKTDSTLQVLVETLVPGRQTRYMAVWELDLELGATKDTQTVIENVWGLDAKEIAGEFVVFGNPFDTITIKGTEVSFDSDEGVVIRIATGSASPTIQVLKGEGDGFKDVGIDVHGQIHTTGKNSDGHAYITRYNNRLTPAWTVETPCNGWGDRISFFEDGSVLWSGDELNNHNRDDTFYVNNDKSKVEIVNQNSDVFVSRISQPNTGVFTTATAELASPYPNPARNTVHVELPENADRLQLVNSLGQVFQVDLSANQGGSTTLNVSGLQPGVYTLILSTEEAVLRSGSFIKL